ncbi:MAG TPA: endospore germination permease [Syntrophomonadaceae bacterium]|nr:endospore germination permease [Syntrophomonadaceae bacterium]
MSSPHSISSQQLTFILTGAQVGSAMLALPALLCTEAGQHAWMAVLLGALFPLASLFFIERLGRRFPGLNFVQVNQTLLGKIGGAAAVLLFVVYVVFFEMEIISSFGRLVQIFMLPSTPIWATLFLAMACVVYAGSKGGKVVGRINETLFFGILISLFFILIPVYYVNDYTNLLPLGEIDPLELGRAVLVSLYAYAGSEVLLVYYSYVKAPDKVISAGLTATALTVSIYLIVTLACLLVFGPDKVVDTIWPGVTILKVAGLSVIERLEFPFLAIWVGIVLRRGINLPFAAALSLAQLFGNENRHGLAMLGVGIVIYFAALFPQSMMVNFMLVNYGCAAYFVIGILYPLFLLGVAWIRKGVVKNA